MNRITAFFSRNFRVQSFCNLELIREILSERELL